MFLDFLAGNQEFHCTPWGMPTRNVFGWQKPCYLLGEGYVKTFTELMETTDWDAYGTGRYEKCANCMAHCGYEATAADAILKHPLKALASPARHQDRRRRWRRKFRSTNQRPAQYVFDGQVQLHALGDPRQRSARESRQGGAEDVGERGVRQPSFRGGPKGPSPESHNPDPNDARSSRRELRRAVRRGLRAPRLTARPGMTSYIPYATARALPLLRLR